MKSVVFPQSSDTSDELKLLSKDVSGFSETVALPRAQAAS